MKTTLLRHSKSLQTPGFSAFSLVEILVAVALIALIVTIALPHVGKVTTGVSQAKLASDVTVLNQAVALYVAEGGRLDNVSNAQEVIDRLKTKRRQDDARRHVGSATGRLVDMRLAARDMTASESASNSPRAVWSSSLQKFVIANRGRGIGAFYFDDQKADQPAKEESRDRSSMLYNGNDGWVWEWQAPGGAAGPTSPSSFVLYSPSAPPDPTAGSGGSGGGSGSGPSTPPGVAPPEEPARLPTPTILPVGGAFVASRYPSTITIGSGGAPSGGSELQYRLNFGSWKKYVTGFSVPSGTRVFARNISLDPDLYLDSAEDSEIYYRMPDIFSGTVVGKWANIKGGNSLVQSLLNLSLDNVKATYGTAVSGSSPNSLEFQRVSSFSVAPDTDFKLGVITYTNGTVKNGTEASSIDLKLDLFLTKPTLRTGSASVHLTLWSSPNTNDAKESADYAQLENPKTDFTFAFDGVTYTLQLRFANVSVVEGWTDGTRLYVYEGSKGRADLIARFVSSF